MGTARLWRVAAGVVSVGVAAGLLMLAPALLGPPILSDRLGRAGFPGAEIGIVAYRLDGAVLSVDLDAGGPLRPGTVEAFWSLAGLWRGRLDRVVVEHVGLRFEDGAGIEGGSDGPLLPVLPVAELALRDVVVELPLPAGRRAYRLSGRLERLPSGGVTILAEMSGGADTLRLALSGREGADGVEDLAGEVRIELAGFPTSGDRSADVLMAGTIASDGRVTRVQPDGPARVEMAGPEGRYAVTVSATAEGPAAFVLDMADGRPRISATGQFGVEGPDGTLAEVQPRELHVVLNDDGPHLSAERVSVRLSGLAAGGLRLSIPEAELSLKGTVRSGRARVEGIVALEGDLPGGGELAGGRAAISGDIHWDDGTLAFFTEACQTITAARLSIGRDGLGTPVDICVQASDGPAISFGPAGLTTSLTLRPDALRFDRAVRSPEASIEATVPEVELALEAGRDGALRSLDLQSAGMSVTLPGQGIAVHDLAAALRLRPRESTVLEVRARTRGVLRGQGPALTGPVALELRAVAKDGDALDLAGALSGAVPAQLSGRFDPVSGSGRLRIDGREMPFGRDAMSPADVSPWLADTIEDFNGTARPRIRLAWRHGESPSGTGELLLRDVGFLLGPVSVQGLNTVLRARSLFPFVLDPGQVVGIGLLDVGVPLTNGQVLFGYGEEGYLGIQEAVWSWAGGTVRANPFRILPEELTADVALDAQGLDLGELLDLLPIEGVSGTGIVSGRIPVEIRGDAVAVRDGRLAAMGTGSLRYRPDEPPAGFDAQAGTELLLQALADFRYDSLVLRLDGTAGGELTARIGIRGANPDFYGGYPVALNLDVSGALDTILRQGIRAYRIPDAVRERMMEFEANGG